MNEEDKALFIELFVKFYKVNDGETKYCKE